MPCLVVLAFALFADLPAHANVALLPADALFQPLGQPVSAEALDADVADPEEDPDPDPIRQSNFRLGWSTESDLGDGRHPGKFRVGRVILGFAPKLGPPPAESC